MNNDQYYYRPRCDERTLEEATERAMYLLDHGYVKTMSGYTEYDLINDVANRLNSSSSTE